MTTIRSPSILRPVTALPPGTYLVMFGGAVELVAVDPNPCPPFPRARLLTIRPAEGGLPMSVLVPADFVPVVLSGSAPSS